MTDKLEDVIVGALFREIRKENEHLDRVCLHNIGAMSKAIADALREKGMVMPEGMTIRMREIRL